MSSADHLAGTPGSPFGGPRTGSSSGASLKKSPEGPTSDSQSIERRVDSSRRTLLIASCTAGGIAGAAALTPLLGSFEPSEKAKAAGAPVEADISGMAVGELRTFEWRGKPVWVIRRSKEMVDGLSKNDAELADPQSKRSPSEFTPMPQTRNEYRSLKPEYLVAVGVCTHLGCSPSARFTAGPQASLPDNWPGGFLCPCHGSTFDLAGRVYKNKPAPDNLPIPPYTFASDTKIIIGEETKA